jgi:hypothetical protein
VDRRRPVLPVALVAVVGVVTLAGAACSDDDTACETVTDVREQVDHVRGLDIEDESVAGLRGALLGLGRSLDDLDDLDDLGDKTEDALDDLDDRIDGLVASLGASSEGESDNTTDLAALDASRAEIVKDADDVLDDVDAHC